MQSVKDLDTKLRKLILANIFIEATKFKETLITHYLDSYSNLLVDLVTDKESLSNPEYFYMDYKKELEAFSYFDDVTDIEEFAFRTPTEDTFNLEDRLSFIKLLINGVAGDYYELPEADYNKLQLVVGGDRFREYLSNMPKFFNDDTPQELRFYLLYHHEDLYRIVRQILSKNLVLFPFSNTPPIDLFGGSILFFEKELEGIINKSIATSINFIKQGT
ncbi:hypothetical protein JZU46_00125 [bacterium]|nr:hypothetical protein [bacterium]